MTDLQGQITAILKANFSSKELDIMFNYLLEDWQKILLETSDMNAIEDEDYSFLEEEQVSARREAKKDKPII